MENTVRMLYVEKKFEFSTESEILLLDLKENLGLSKIKQLRIINCYEIQGISDKAYDLALNTVFSEPNIDNIYLEKINLEGFNFIFRYSYLKGQFDQRAEYAKECIQIITPNENPIVHSSKVIAIDGDLSKAQKELIKSYLINKVDSHEIKLEKSKNLCHCYIEPEEVKTIENFINFSNNETLEFHKNNKFSMTIKDLLFCQKYFKEIEKRDPTITELKVIDTYWSDHCRHTTFLTEIENVKFEEGNFIAPIIESYNQYLSDRKFLNQDNKSNSLMDLAICAKKKLKKLGYLTNLDESNEINACSIKLKVDIDETFENYLIMFKNETHNHPTEIEPFGGAATCLGGAIRDPLSGRAYVYQAMRISGASDPRAKIEDTLKGKLPQRKITIGAANGYSSYGNQIGIATGFVKEYYHEGFVAKRMEVGAVIAAVPEHNIVRKQPKEGDLVLLIGGRTGRDGIGGATGSSKQHTEESISTCGAEVQKGNATIERKLQRLFRNPKASRLIKRCNDFGAGGVCVAIGELSDSILINLDNILKKYQGLDGTELAISESQERMAVVIASENIDEFMNYSKEENLECTVVATILNNERLIMKWKEKVIFDVSREFLNTNGIKSAINVYVSNPEEKNNYFIRQDFLSKSEIENKWLNLLTNLNTASNRGLVERFDSTIGTGNVLFPFGGKYYKTPIEGMVSKIPVICGETNTGTIMTNGYNPYLSSWSPFHGGIYAVIESISKIVAMGGDYKETYLTLQEYFERLGEDEKKWGKPFSALLGANYVQNQLKIAAIGGKDSMSGSFNEIDVPPTLISFAVCPVDVRKVISNELKERNSLLVLIKLNRDLYEMPDFNALKNNFTIIYSLIKNNQILSSHTVEVGGVAIALSKMSFGNMIGINILDTIEPLLLFEEAYGSIILEVSNDFDKSLLKEISFIEIGNTNNSSDITYKNIKFDIKELIKIWESPMEQVFPTKTNININIDSVSFNCKNIRKSMSNYTKPKVFIPIFPGTNCEYDTERAFKKEGAKVCCEIFNNLNKNTVAESIEKFCSIIKSSQIIALAGGFSALDEPDGSGKFISSIFRNPKIKESIDEFLYTKDGLIIGICNGFQALIKLGLLPYGSITELSSNSPTLTYNKIGRHVSKVVRTKVLSNISPWLTQVKLGEVYEVFVSHGEGRFYADNYTLDRLIENGQIATQYVDLDNNPTYNSEYNPNGSVYAVEGLTNADGRIFGKMGHSERISKNICINSYHQKDMKIFKSGVLYFK